MDKFRSEIIEITKHRPEIGLTYYNDLLDIVDQYNEKKPDASIETCKAILEGLSKLIIHKIKQEPISQLDKSTDFKDLVKRALEVLNEELQYFDKDFVKRITSIVQYIGEVRNGHCDISHGRASLKEQVSSKEFSQMISGFTESIAIYLLKKLDEVIMIEYHYDSEQMEEYNTWLDESQKDFPIQTEKYSKILFEYDRNLYEARYLEEFLILEDFKQQDQEEQQEEEQQEEKGTAIQISEINSRYFTTDEQKSLIKELAEVENLNIKGLINILDNFFFDNESPTKDQYLELLKEPIQDERTELLVLERKINDLIEELAQII